MSVGSLVFKVGGKSLALFGLVIFGWKVLNLGGGSCLSGESSVLFEWRVYYSVWMEST